MSIMLVSDDKEPQDLLADVITCVLLCFIAFVVVYFMKGLIWVFVKIFSLCSNSPLPPSSNDYSKFLLVLFSGHQLLHLIFSILILVLFFFDHIIPSPTIDTTIDPPPPTTIVPYWGFIILTGSSLIYLMLVLALGSLRYMKSFGRFGIPIIDMAVAISGLIEGIGAPSITEVPTIYDYVTGSGKDFAVISVIFLLSVINFRLNHIDCLISNDGISQNKDQPSTGTPARHPNERHPSESPFRPASNHSDFSPFPKSSKNGFNSNQLRRNHFSYDDDDDYYEDQMNVDHRFPPYQHQQQQDPINTNFNLTQSLPLHRPTNSPNYSNLSHSFIHSPSAAAAAAAAAASASGHKLPRNNPFKRNFYENNFNNNNNNNNNNRQQFNNTNGVSQDLLHKFRTFNI